jgi:hypothetical protein
VTTIPFVIEFDPSKVAEPNQGSLYRLPCLAEPTSMLIPQAQWGQHRTDPKELNQRSKCFRSKAGITLEGDRSLSWASSLPGEYHADRSRHGVGILLLHGLSGSDRCGPPNKARALALSIKARSNRTAPDLPSSRTTKECSRDQTDNRVHSANRLQHVEPLPHCNSLGMDCHGDHVFREKTIPAKRSSMWNWRTPSL